MTVHSFDHAVRLLHDRVNLERLQSFRPQDMEGRLDSLRQILDTLHHPETAYRTVHMTGTKGKGSTCIMLESMLRQHGWRVGRFTSPHIDSFTERLAINGIPCPEQAFAELFFSVHAQIPPETFQPLTYFELLTLLAFAYFSREQVDVALFEVGLGGRLDATNLCMPNVSVITSISYDHMLQLGNTLAAIAAEKSGIIKPRIPVVTTVQHTEPLQIIRSKAEALHAPLYVLGEHFAVQPAGTSQFSFRYETLPEQFPVPPSLNNITLDNITLTMPGRHQVRNAAAALSAFLLLHQGEQCFHAEMIREGLRQAVLPLRGETIHLSEHLPTLFFDGAHNRASMKTFVETALAMFPNRRLVLIFGSSQGKDLEGMFAEIGDHFDRIVLTQSSNVRRLPPEALLQISSLKLEKANITITDNCQDALKQCVQSAHPNDVICIAGSLYLAAELRRMALGQ